MLAACQAFGRPVPASGVLCLPGFFFVCQLFCACQWCLGVSPVVFLCVLSVVFFVFASGVFLCLSVFFLALLMWDLVGCCSHVLSLCFLIDVRKALNGVSASYGVKHWLGQQRM